MTPEAFLAWLSAQGMAHETRWHDPVFTVAESKALGVQEGMDGAHVKNLFLRDKAGGFWLATLLEHRRVPIGALARALDLPRMSFAAADDLAALLGVTPGSVTPFALVNDRAMRVGFILDSALAGMDGRINAHPLTNTATTAITLTDFHRFLAATGHVPRVIDLAPLEATAALG